MALAVEWAEVPVNKVIEVQKYDKETGQAAARGKGATFAGAEYTIFTDAACTMLVEVIKTDANGYAKSSELPIAAYYVKETKAPAGFVSSDEVIDYDASYQGQDIPVVKLSAVKKNEPTTFEFTKSDITTGVELDGATLTVMDGKGNVIPELLLRETRDWKSMWINDDYHYCELDLTAAPTEAGDYTLSLYFNGDAVMVIEFSIH